MTSVGSGWDLSSDAELITAVRSGEAVAFGVLYERHCAAARAVARQYTNSAADAEDAVSDAFSRVFAAIQQGGGPDVAFRAYLFTVLRRVALHRVETGRRALPTDDLETLERAAGPSGSTEEPALAEFERGVVSEAYKSLPERWQAVLWYTEVERLSPAEIAPVLGLTANGVAALAYRAREGLRQAYLQQHLGAPADDGCTIVNGKLGAYVRGGLAKRETALVELHLDDCGRCRALVLELGDVNHGMRVVIGPMVLGAVALGVLHGLGFGGAAGAAAATGGALGGGAAASGAGSAAAGSGAAGAGTGVGTGVGTGLGVGAGSGTSVGAGAATSGVAASGAAASGAVTTGAVTTGAVTTGAVTAGAVTSGAVASGAAASGAASTAAASGLVAVGAAVGGAAPAVAAPVVGAAAAVGVGTVAGAATGSAASGGLAGLLAGAPLGAIGLGAAGVVVAATVGVAGVMGVFSSTPTEEPPSTSVVAGDEGTGGDGAESPQEAPTPDGAEVPAVPPADPFTPDDGTSTPGTGSGAVSPAAPAPQPLAAPVAPAPAPVPPPATQPVPPSDPEPDPEPEPGPGPAVLVVGSFTDLAFVSGVATTVPVTVSNTGESVAAEVTTAFTFPEGTTGTVQALPTVSGAFGAARAAANPADWTCVATSAGAECTLDELAPGATSTLNAMVLVTEDGLDGGHPVALGISTWRAGSDVRLTATVAGYLASPRAVISAGAPQAAVVQGGADGTGSGRLVVPVTNSGGTSVPVTAQVAFGDALAGLSVSAEGPWSCAPASGGLSCSLPLLVRGTTTDLALTLSGAVPDDTDLTAPVTVRLPDGQAATTATVRSAPADLEVDMPGAVTLAPGDTRTMTVVVRNVGRSTAYDVVAAVDLPGSLVLRDVSGAGWACTTGGSPTCTLPALAPGESRAVTLRVLGTGAPSDDVLRTSASAATTSATGTSAVTIVAPEPPSCPAAWTRFGDYGVGDRVSYEGFVYRRTSSLPSILPPDSALALWTRLGPCD